jgi:YidC/Oxa1 family membrane protein insertase
MATVWLLLAAVLMSPAWSAGKQLSTPTLELEWLDEKPSPTTWRATTEPGTGEDQWRSFIERDNQGQPFSRHLDIEIPGLQLTGWQTEVDDNGVIVTTAESDDAAFAITLTIAEAGDYRLSLAVELENRGAPAANGPVPDEVRLVLGPGIGEPPVDGLGIATGLYSFVDVVGTAGGRVQRFSASDVPGPTVLESLAEPDWAGLHSRYFALLIKPVDTATIAHVQAQYPEGDHHASAPGAFLPMLQLSLSGLPQSAGQTSRYDFTVFSGPRSRTALRDEHSDFRGLLFPGLWEWMRMLCFALLWVLEALFALIPSWGLAIIALALLVRLAMYPLARRALASQQAFADVQRTIQPEIRRIKQQYKGGEQSERILQLYEQHDTSPLAGLKPLLIVLVQIPIFIALFHVLGQAYELRDAPFLWMDTLAEPDQLFHFGTELPFFGAWFNLLPVLLALSTLLTLKLSPAPAADRAAQRRQNYFLALMTVGFFLVFYPFPSGMVLYWTAANILHIAQSLVMRRAGNADGETASPG